MPPLACGACSRVNPDSADRCAQCGAALREAAGAGAALTYQPTDAPTPTEDPYLGKVFTHYRVEELLGKGGMGVVYRGTDLKLGRAVALKFLSPERARDAQARARFGREARAASALDHPNIGTFYDLDEIDGVSFLSMALYEGETLRDRLRRGTPPLEDTERILSALTSALDAAHRAGITHRDVKPANVMLTRDGQVKLLDFGLAKLVSMDEPDDLMTTEGAILGTAAYMAPEQLRIDPMDHRVDLWSLGVVAHEMLSGRPPFGSGPAAVVCARILADSPAALPATAPPHLAELITRLLKKPPSERPADAATVLAALKGPNAPREQTGQTATIAAPTTAAAPAAPSRPPRSRRRRVALSIAAGAALFVLALPVGRLLWPQPEPAIPPAPPPPLPVTPRPTHVEVTTNAPRATFFVDGRRVAIEAAVLSLDELPPGSHELRVEAAGYFARKTTFELAPGQSLALSSTLDPMKGKQRRGKAGNAAQVKWPASQ